MELLDMIAVFLKKYFEKFKKYFAKTKDILSVFKDELLNFEKIIAK